METEGTLETVDEVGTEGMTGDTATWETGDQWRQKALWETVDADEVGTEGMTGDTGTVDADRSVETGTEAGTEETEETGGLE